MRALLLLLMSIVLLASPVTSVLGETGPHSFPLSYAAEPGRANARLFGLTLSLDDHDDDSDSDAHDDDDDDDDETDAEDFLFRLEEAYTQEEGELQVAISYSFLSGRETEREFEFEGLIPEIEKETSRNRTHEYVLEIEYGITDRLQVEVEIPYFSVRSHSFEPLEKAGDLGDMEIGIGYALIQETETLPAVTAAFEVALPTGNHEKEIGLDRLGFGGGLAISKDFGQWVGHVNFGVEYVGNARIHFENGENGPEQDLIGYEYGGGVVYKVNEQWQAMLELAGETEQELELNGRTWETEVSLTPGLRYGFETESAGAFEFGVGFPIGLTSDADDWGVIAKFQWEIGD